MLRVVPYFNIFITLFYYGSSYVQSHLLDGASDYVGGGSSICDEVEEFNSR